MSSGECILPKTSAGVDWCWVAAQLYDQEIFAGVSALTYACCQPALQSSTEQWKIHFAHTQCCSALVLGRCTAV